MEAAAIPRAPFPIFILSFFYCYVEAVFDVSHGLYELVVVICGGYPVAVVLAAGVSTCSTIPITHELCLFSAILPASSTDF